MARPQATRGGFSTPEASRADISRRLRIAAERLGPTYIKLGQIISSGEGLFPEPLVVEFRKCRDQVPAETFDVVRRVVEEDLRQPLEVGVLVRSTGTRSRPRRSRRCTPRRLRTGEDVVVKVQRPR